MGQIRKIEAAVPMIPKRKKVAAYARVSKETERLTHSISAQISYYSKLIQSNPEWEYAGVYADFGISGTGTGKRDEFNRLIADCETGKIDIVLTKSISRFARNTVDLLETVRHLKGMGIEVRFEKEKIHSMSNDGELMLSILASFAQEEVQSMSENIKWGIRKTYEKGYDGVRNKKVLGYRYNGEQYVIKEDEAEIVRFIFKEYIDGITLRNIKRHLEDMGAKSWRGYDLSYHHINYIVHNEIYCGDRLLQKCFVEDPLRQNKIPNKGQLPQYYMTDCHEPIIDKETFRLAQLEAERRAGMINPTYCFTRKIKCGVCGTSYTRKKGTHKGKTYVHWICRSKKEVGVTCASMNFGEEELKKVCADVLELPSFDEEVFGGEVKSIVVQENGNLEFHFFGGGKKMWKNLNLHPARHEVTITDCFQKKIRCAICGNTYHRVNSAGQWVYWYCIGKKRKGVTCNSTNYADFQLRRISAYIMETEEFDEAEFDKQIENIHVLADGSLEYKFYDGRAKRWEKA